MWDCSGVEEDGFMWKSEVVGKGSRRLWWVVIIKLFRESAIWLHNVSWKEVVSNNKRVLLVLPHLVLND